MKRFCRTSLLSILALLCTLAVSACDGKADDGKTDEITITVTFRVDAATHATVEVKAGAAMPADPQKEGFTFVGWFLDEAELTQAFTSFTGITANVTVYAKWAPAGEGTPDAITVTFMADGATHATVEVKAGAAMPADPQKEGYTFAGWFLDNVTFSESFLNLTGITANVTVYAKWTIKAEEPLLVYTLINDGTAYEVTIRSGAAADAGEVVIPSLHEGKPVVSIGDNAFYGSALTGITLPNGIIRIGSNAFAYCASLSGITIPSSVTDIDDSAFSGCTSLSVTWNYNPDLTARSFTQLVKTVIIPDGVKNIGEWAFRDCGALANITIPSGVLSIGAVAFAGCSALTSITLPDSVLSIGDKAFEGCNALTSITLGNGVTQIGSDVFANCVKLTDITIPGSVSSIGYNDFYGFTNLSITWYYNPALSASGLGFKQFIKTIIVPDSVTAIGMNAFTGCSGLTSITIPFVGRALGGTSNTHFGYLFGASPRRENNPSIPSSLRTVIITGGSSIANDAFFFCTGLTSITLPDSVTTIGMTAFAGCSGLTGFIIPDNVTKIDTAAFAGCSALTGITIPANVTNIGTPAFVDCSSLASITVASGNTVYKSEGNCLIRFSANELISGCKNSVIPSDIRSIAAEAFSGCTGLKSITIPDGVMNISSSMFYGCTGLTSITIPDSVKSIGSSAFEGCTGLANISIGSGITSIATRAFYNCSGLTSITVADGNTVYKSEGDCLIRLGVNELILGCKNSIIPMDAASIGGNAFSGCTGLTSITIPDSVKSIGSNAFYGCTGLTSISIGSGVTSIVANAFYNCTGLTSITVADGNTVYKSEENSLIRLEDNALILGCKNGAIPDGVTSIGDYAFYNYSALWGITIPDSVTSIGNNAFSGCNGLSSITVADGNTVYKSEGNCLIRIADNALILGCKNSVIPSSVTGIDDYAFRNYSSFSITIPDSVTSIGEYAFEGCENLSITWHYNPALTGTKIGEYLKSVIFPDSISAIGDSAFYGCGGLEYITIPDSLTSIGDSAFAGCSSLSSLTIPGSVTEIGNYAFAGCERLMFLTIPDSVSSIGNAVFAGCERLIYVTIQGKADQAAADAAWGDAWRIDCNATISYQP